MLTYKCWKYAELEIMVKYGSPVNEANFMEQTQNEAGNACEKAENMKLVKLIKRLKHGECLRRVKLVKRVK